MTVWTFLTLPGIMGQHALATCMMAEIPARVHLAPMPEVNAMSLDRMPTFGRWSFFPSAADTPAGRHHPVSPAPHAAPPTLLSGSAGLCRYRETFDALLRNEAFAAAIGPGAVSGD